MVLKWREWYIDLNVNEVASGELAPLLLSPGTARRRSADQCGQFMTNGILTCHFSRHVVVTDEAMPLSLS